MPDYQQYKKAALLRQPLQYYIPIVDLLITHIIDIFARHINNY